MIRRYLGAYQSNREFMAVGISRFATRFQKRASCL